MHEEFCGSVKLIDRQIASIESINIPSTLFSLNLHHNTLRSISGLELAGQLQYLDLSSNFISDITGLENLRNLKVLNLSSNAIRSVTALNNLHSLVRLDLSFNNITDISGIRELSGEDYSLETIFLQGNKLSSLEHVISSLAGLRRLRYLTLFDRQHEFNNPVCEVPGYRQSILGALPKLAVLDYFDRSGSVASGSSSLDIPELSEVFDGKSTLSKSVTSARDTPSHLGDNRQHSAVSHTSCSARRYRRSCSANNCPPDLETPTQHECSISFLTEQRLVNLETQLSSLVALQMMRIDPHSSEVASCDRASVIPGQLSAGGPCEEAFGVEQNDQVIDAALNGEVSTRNGEIGAATSQPPELGVQSFITTSSHQTGDQHPPGAPKKHPLQRTTSRNPPSKSTSNQTNTRRVQANVQINRERSPLGHQRLAAQMMPTVSKLECRQSSKRSSSSDRTISDLVKELESERLQRKQMEQLYHDLTNRIARLEQSMVSDDQALEATNRLKEAYSTERRSRMEAENKLRQLEDARTLDLATRFDELTKEFHEASERALQAEQRLNEVQTQLKTKEEEFETLLRKVNSSDHVESSQVMAARIEAVEAKYEHITHALGEKLEVSKAQFQALEDEFRLALRIEAERYAELYNRSELLQQQLLEADSLRKDAEQREASAQQLISEMTTAMSEQKSLSCEQAKSQRLAQHNQKTRISQLESELEKASQAVVELDSLRKENQDLKAALSAQESLVLGLRAERRNWSEELAKQGSALARDRGLLEAKLENQQAEIQRLMTALEEEKDNLKIKSKVVDDQQETIEKLKNDLTSHQSEIKRIHEESATSNRQLDNETRKLKRENSEHREKIEQLLLRKQELKEMITALQSRIVELEKENNTLTQRWSERSNLLDRFEVQLEQMKQSWEQEKVRLIDERDTAADQVSQLSQQIVHLEAEHERQIDRLSKSKDEALNAIRANAEQLRSACESRVLEVEAEMRALLVESETTKKVMESRLRKLSAVLCEPPVYRGTTDGATRMCHSSMALQPPNIDAIRK